MKLLALGIDRSLYDWIFDFLPNRRQTVRLRQGSNELLSDSIFLNTGAPQGCVLSPVLYSLMTYDCEVTSQFCHLTKFADDTTLARHDSRVVMRQITDVESMIWQCDVPRTNSSLMSSRQQDMLIDFRLEEGTNSSALHLRCRGGASIDSFKFLGIHISSDLTLTLERCMSRTFRKQHNKDCSSCGA